MSTAAPTLGLDIPGGRDLPDLSSALLPVNNFSAAPNQIELPASGARWVSIENHSAHTFYVEIFSTAASKIAFPLNQGAIESLALPFPMSSIRITDLSWNHVYLPLTFQREGAGSSERNEEAYPYVNTALSSNAFPLGYVLLNTATAPIDRRREFRPNIRKVNWITQLTPATLTTFKGSDVFTLSTSAIAADLPSGFSAANPAPGTFSFQVYPSSTAVPSVADNYTLTVPANGALDLTVDFDQIVATFTAANQQILISQAVVYAVQGGL